MSPARSTPALVLTLVFLAAAGATAALVIMRPHGPIPGAAALNAEPSPDASGLPVLFAAPSFNLTDENGHAFPSSALAGRPYVAAFIFTHCTSSCPMITGRMSAIQKDIPPGVDMVSFTVDPDRDTPDVLKAYAEKFHADAARWHFLTGAPAELAKAEEGFHVRIPRSEPTTNDGPAHYERLLLVDARGQVRGTYDRTDEDAFALQQAAAKLAALPR